LTLGVPVVVFFLGYIPLPFVDWLPLATASMTDDPIGGFFNLPPRRVGMTTLGLTPLLFSFIAVECVTAVVPRWKHLRVSGPDGRHHLLRVTLILGAALTIFQAWSTATFLRSLQLNTTPGAVFSASVIFTLCAATALLFVVARVLDATALVNGISLLLAGDALYPLVSSGIHLLLLTSHGELAGLDVIVCALLHFLVIGIVVTVLSANRRHSLARADRVTLTLPSSGWVPPVVAAASLLAIPATLSSLRVPVGFTLPPDGWVYRVSYGLLIILLVFAMAFAFNAPRRVAAVYRNAWRHEIRRESLARLVTQSALSSAALVVGCLLLVWLATSRFTGKLASGALALESSALNVVIVTAVVMDIIDEWKARARGALVPIWPLHRVYAVHPVTQALLQAGIQVHLRGQHHRTMFQFFGPYLPMQVMVSPTDASAARQIMKRMCIAPTPDTAQPLLT